MGRHNLDEIIKFTNGLDKTIIRVEGLEPVIFISTLEGYMKASVGDYIIRGLRGEYYPCKPDIFHKNTKKIRKRSRTIMRKYKSKFMKPYIRKLKAGDLKRITSQMTFQALLNECIIDYARRYKKQVYVLTFAGSRDILDVSMNKKKLRNSIVAIDTSNREYNIIRNSWKRSIQRMKQNDRRKNGGNQ